MRNGFSGELDKQFEVYTKAAGEELTRALARGLRKAANEVVNLTKQNAKSGMLKRNNPHWYDGKMVTYNDNIEDAPRHGKVYNGGYGSVADDMYVNISIFGSTARDSGTFRFRFLDQGTKQRFAKYYRTKTGERKLLRKPRNLGLISPRWWFKNAYQSVVPSVDSIILAELEKTANKLNSQL